MYIELGVNLKEIASGGARNTINHFVLDTSDNSIEYITNSEFKSIKNLVQVPNSRPEPTGEQLARLSVCGSGMELYRDNLVSVRLSYEPYLAKFWAIEFMSLNMNRLLLKYDLDASEYDFNNLMSWDYIDDKTYDGYRTKVYGIYVCNLYATYIANANLDVKNREIMMMLESCKFKYTTSNGYVYVLDGYSALRKLIQTIGF